MMDQPAAAVATDPDDPPRPQTAGAELLWAYREDVAAFARTLCRNPADAEDIAHDALVRAARATGSDRSDLRMWLHRLAALECRTARKRRHDPSLEALIDRIVTDDRDGSGVVDGDGPFPDPETLTLELETRREVLAALERLPDRYRRALVLRDGAGATLTDVADALSTTPEAAKAIVHRAREALRKAVRRPI